MSPVKLIGGISNIPQAFYFFKKIFTCFRFFYILLLSRVSCLLISLHTHILLAPLGIFSSHLASYPYFSAVSGIILAYFPSYPHLARSLGYFLLTSCLIPMILCCIGYHTCLFSFIPTSCSFPWVFSPSYPVSYPWLNALA